MSKMILTAICQTGTPVTPRRNIVNTGAVKGKIVRTTQAGLVGNSISTEKNQNGAKLKMEYIADKPLASCKLEVTAAIPAESTANIV